MTNFVDIDFEIKIMSYFLGMLVFAVNIILIVIFNIPLLYLLIIFALEILFPFIFYAVKEFFD